METLEQARKKVRDLGKYCFGDWLDAYFPYKECRACSALPECAEEDWAKAEEGYAEECERQQAMKKIRDLGKQ
jgi:hypothetical protein